LTDIATLIADMIRAGVDADLIGRAAAALAEREPVRVVDDQAERRRAADRARKASQRLRNSAESADTNEPPFAPEGSPHTPFLNPSIPNPPSPPKGGSSPAENEFDATFWPAYPHKVGKPDAKRKFVIARRKASLETIMAGLDAYRSKTDDRPWCNPATWLHQERWGDQPANVVPIRGSPARRNELADGFGAMSEYLKEKIDDRHPPQTATALLDLSASAR